MLREGMGIHVSSKCVCVQLLALLIRLRAAWRGSKIGAPINHEIDRNPSLGLSKTLVDLTWLMVAAHPKNRALLPMDDHYRNGEYRTQNPQT
jgi:hypothetical protein